ncbi:hypothetical protein [Stieleria varia]|uniref:GLTT repeat (6 copies) n=1 Tax=Stieleria varia TaxID=2528005 RepID=A0A5C6B178_9BACT|nr:hypothetical protein [Stieleria varia]TWU06065.1 GLTT repeat (6 copies) [Stieleria varia]
MDRQTTRAHQRRFASKAWWNVFAVIGLALAWSGGSVKDAFSDDACDSQESECRRCSVLDRFGASSTLVPTGDLAPRIPHDSFQIYYYDRPYSPLHVGEHWTGAGKAGEPHQPYNTDHFRDIYESVEREFMTNGLTTNGLTTNGLTTNGLTTNGLTTNGEDGMQDQVREVVTRDKSLEYVDWRAYRRVRLIWDAESGAVTEGASR